MNRFPTRRTFLARGSAAVAGAALARGTRRRQDPVVATPPGISVDSVIRVETDPAVKALALRAIDAAKAAGATYADVRLTRTLQQVDRGITEGYAVGVRALVNGYWGFAASPYWTPEEVTQLAKDATAQAKVNALGTTRPVELGTVPVASGSWRTPVRIDPFTVPFQERAEYLDSVCELAKQCYRGARAYPRAIDLAMWTPVGFTRQERAVATTEGAYFTQTTYATSTGFLLRLADAEVDTSKLLPGTTTAGPTGLGTQAMGWEMILDANIPAQIPAMIATIEDSMRWTAKQGDIGQYDVVFAAGPMAILIAETLGDATQLDYAMGLEANAAGTSYLDDPLGMLGRLQVASPLVTVTANRSAPAQLATVKWDDEGVEPADFTLIKDGVLVDYQTTREQAAWLKEYYQKAGKPVRSHGCAAAPDATFLTMQQVPNLALAPAKEDISFDDLVRDTKKGLAVIGVNLPDMDFQRRSGALPTVLIREIVNGRLGRVVNFPPLGLEILFTSDQLWKNIKAIGGSRSTATVPRTNTKGQPPGSTPFTVSAVPAKVTNVTFVDPARKA